MGYKLNYEIFGGVEKGNNIYACPAFPVFRPGFTSRRAVVGLNIVVRAEVAS